MYETVKHYLDNALHQAALLNSNTERRSMYDNAFGALSIAYYSFTTTEAERSELEFLWQEYRIKFERLVYGI